MFHIHQLPGRLRVRSAVLKGNEQLASSALGVIPALRGVTSTSINTVTGSILVNYNASLTHSAPIIRELNKLKILHGILAFPRPMPKKIVALPSNTSKRLSEQAMNKKLLGDLCLAAGKIFLLTLLEQTASSAAKAIVRKIL